MTTSLYNPPRREQEYTRERAGGADRMWLPLTRPTDEALREIGAWVVRELRDSPIRDDLIGQTKVVYLRVNAS